MTFRSHIFVAMAVSFLSTFALTLDSANAQARGRGQGPPRGQPRTDYGEADIAFELFGTSEISPSEVMAGSQTTVTLVYKAGSYGMSIGGKLKYGVHQHDMTTRSWGIPQITDPDGPNYLTVSSSNPNARFTLQPPPTERDNPRQLPVHEFTRARKRYVYEAVLSGDRLRPGDTVTFLYGFRNGGEPGVQAQRGAPGKGYFFLWADTLADSIYHEIKVERIYVFAAGPTGLVCYTPSNVEVGEPFEILVKARDPYYNLAHDYRGTVSFVEAEGLGLPESYTFTEKDRGVHTFLAAGARKEGDYTVTVLDDPSGFSAESNPLSTNFYDSGENLYWGDIHGHSENSDGDMTAEDFYHYGRNFARLDFCSLTDHVGQIAYFAWDALRDAAQRANEPGRFVAIPGWELGGGIHRLGYFFSLDPPMSVPSRRMPAAYDYALEHPNEKVLFTVHHQGRENMDDPNRGWTRNYDSIRTTVEAYSWWRNSVFQSPREDPENEVEHWELLYHEALSRGLHVGIYAGGDNHIGQPGAYQNGLTGLIASELSRDRVYQGLKRHDTFATTGVRALLKFEINGQKMGSTLESKTDPELSIRLLGTAPIKRVDIYRQAKVVKTFAGDGKRAFQWKGSLEKEPGAEESYYFFKAYQTDGNRVWSSPIWVK